MGTEQKFKKEFQEAKLADGGIVTNASSHEQFEKVLQNRCLSMREVLGTKAEEYAKGGNRYHNFDVAARVLGVTPPQALLGMWMKHIVSVLDMIAAEKPLDEKVIDEKIGGLINYAVLLEGLWKR